MFNWSPQFFEYLSAAWLNCNWFLGDFNFWSRLFSTCTQIWIESETANEKTLKYFHLKQFWHEKMGAKFIIFLRDKCIVHWSLDACSCYQQTDFTCGCCFSFLTWPVHLDGNSLCGFVSARHPKCLRHLPQFLFVTQCTMVRLKNGVKSSQLWKIISPPIFNESLPNFER